MAVFRWGQSWGPLGDLEREVDRLLQGVNLAFHGVRLGRQFPAVNLYELEHEYLLTAQLPGTRAEDLDLTIAGGILTMKGRRDDPAGIPDDSFRRHERFRGNWQRVLSLPDRVQEDRLRAEFEHGVLQIFLPKVEQPVPRQIPVTDGGDR